jgi:hypothetical protein
VFGSSPSHGIRATACAGVCNFRCADRVTAIHQDEVFRVDLATRLGRVRLMSAVRGRVSPTTPAVAPADHSRTRLAAHVSPPPASRSGGVHRPKGEPPSTSGVRGIGSRSTARGALSCSSLQVSAVQHALLGVPYLP